MKDKTIDAIWGHLEMYVVEIIMWWTSLKAVKVLYCNFIPAIFLANICGITTLQSSGKYHKMKKVIK